MFLKVEKRKLGVYELICFIILIFVVFQSKQNDMAISRMGSVIFTVLLQGMIVSAAIWVANYLNFSIGDYILITLFVFCTKMYWYTHATYILLLLYGLFGIIYLFTLIHYGKLRERSLECFLSNFFGLMGYIWYEVLQRAILTNIYHYFIHAYSVNRVKKIIFLSAEALVTFIAIGFLLLIIKKVSQKYFSRIHEISTKNVEIARYILIFPWLLGVVLWMFTSIKGFFYVMSPIGIYKFIIIGIVILMFGMQLMYIRMLVKTSQLKEHLLREQQEKNTMEEYNSNLAKNIQAMREIKHDIRNIFFTMGEYVDRSNDQTLIEYYHEKVVPFASQEFKMNDLYVSLQKVRSESLRAFLYYKLMQGMENQVDMQLQVAMDGSYFTGFKNLPDIIRILGIFIDNAIEEAVLTNEAVVKLMIRENQGTMSFAVKNTVRDVTKESGVVKGTSTKGIGRGLGLEIASKIVDKYDDLLWNSYFQDGLYVQIISAEK